MQLLDTIRLVNLTRSPLKLYDRSGGAVVLPPDPRHVGLVGVTDHRSVSDADGRTYALAVQRVRGVKGMPEPEEGTVYIVPIEIAVALQQERDDVVYASEEGSQRNAEDGIRRVSLLRRFAPNQP